MTPKTISQIILEHLPQTPISRRELLELILKHHPERNPGSIINIFQSMRNHGLISIYGPRYDLMIKHGPENQDIDKWQSRLPQSLMAE